MAVGDLTWPDILDRNERDAAGRPALLFEGGTVTHGEMGRRARRVGAGLRRAGIGPGDRVAIVAQNRPDFLDALNGCARIGAVAVLVNWRLGADEIAHVVADTAPAAILAEADFAATVPEQAAPARFALDVPPAGWRPWADLAESGPDMDAPGPDLRASDPLAIIHTAAVDGRSRGAVLTHGNVVAANAQLAAAWSLGAADVALGVLPLFHIAGLGLVLAAQAAGGASVLLRRFDPAEAVAAVERHRVTGLFEFAPILGQILDAAGDAGRLASLRAVWGLDSPETIARFEAACPAAVFWSGFGQSETTGFVTFGRHRDRPGSAGRPGPLAALAVVDEDDRPVPAGTVGEIVVRGPLVFGGYWRREPETAVTFRSGWHHTGDMGRLDPDGYLFYAGRSPAKELIKSGGENVYPAEVEAALRAHPDVEAAVVFGLPDPRWGEAVAAVCARRPGSDPREAELIAFVGERIARFKRPKTVAIVDALPLTAAGAVDRARVKAEHGAG